MNIHCLSLLLIFVLLLNLQWCLQSSFFGTNSLLLLTYAPPASCFFFLIVLLYLFTFATSFLLFFGDAIFPNSIILLGHFLLHQTSVHWSNRDSINTILQIEPCHSNVCLFFSNRTLSFLNLSYSPADDSSDNVSYRW